MMNKSIFIVLLLLSCFSGMGQTRVIEKPLFTWRTLDNVEVRKVVLGPEETVVTLDASACGGRLTKVNSGLYLQADGQHYALRQCRGITLPSNIISEVKMDAAHPCFDLVFPALPKSVKSVDLIFYKNLKGGSYEILDIQLEKKRADVLKRVPADLKKYKFDHTRSWEKPVYRSGRTRLEVHLLGYKPEMGELLKISWDGLMPGMEEILVGEDGSVVLEVNQYMTTLFQVHCGVRNIGVVVDPGENAELYIDLREANLRYSTYFRDGKRRAAGYFRGNRMDLNQRLLARLDLKADTGDLSWDKDVTVDFDKYIDLCLKAYREAQEALASDRSLSEEYRYYAGLELQLACVNRIQRVRACMVNVYGWGMGDERLPRVTSGCFERLGGIDLNNYDLMLADWPGKDNFFRLFKSEEDVKDVFGTGYILDAYKALACQNRIALRLPLREQEMTVARTMSNPDVVKAFETAYAEGPALWKKHISKPGYRICTLPKDIPGERVFEEILKNYRGRVVFIDCWGTACVPCIKAMKMMHPVEEEFKDRVAFVFLTNEASPEELWQQMIPNIGGDHYRLPKKQDRALVKQFNIQGNPYYILVGKDGKVRYESLGFMGCETLRKVLREAVEDL